MVKFIRVFLIIFAVFLWQDCFVAKAQSNAGAAANSSVPLREARAGNPDAQVAVGAYLVSGFNGERRPLEAAAWFKRASDQGSIDGMAYYGRMLLLGDGLVLDSGTGLQMLQQAASQGSIVGKTWLALAYQDGLGGITRDYNQALVLLQTATANNYAPAWTLLGNQYFRGLGVKRDFAKAFQYYNTAAAVKDSSAELHLGEMYFLGEGVPVDYAQALKWLDRAERHRNMVAEFRLARMYARGLGVKPNANEAVRFLSLSAQDGYPPAQTRLAIRYYTGSGVPKNNVLAYFWCRQAANKGDRAAQTQINEIQAAMTPDELAAATKLTN